LLLLLLLLLPLLLLLRLEGASKPLAMHASTLRPCTLLLVLL
jgi:hypothetical protein